MRWKMTLCKRQTFLNGPMFNVLLYCRITERKWLLMRNIAIIVPSKSKLFKKFQRSIVLIKVSNYWKIVEFQKTSIKMKNYKTFYETQTASRLKKLFSFPQPAIPPDKILIRLWNKNCLERYTEIYRHLLLKCFKKVVLRRQEMVQCKCFFWH